MTEKSYRLCTYFAHDDYILVRLGWSCQTGQKSMAMCKISNKPNLVLMLQAVPIRCPNPQPCMVKYQNQQKISFEIPNCLIFQIYSIIFQPLLRAFFSPSPKYLHTRVQFFSQQILNSWSVEHHIVSRQTPNACIVLFIYK